MLPSLMMMLVLLMPSCAGNVLQHQHKDIQPSGWDRGDTLTFSIPPVSVDANYSITIEMRTPPTFPLQEVWMVRKVLTTNPLSLHLDTICLPTTTDGRSLSGDGVTMRNHSLDTPSIFLNQHQEGTIQLYHIMSQQVLPQVSSVGVKVEIAN